jgi:hypothetical protein
MMGCVFRWQNLVTRAEERHKLVTASLNFYKTAEQVSLTQRFLAIYGPVIYTVSYVMFMMRVGPLRGQVGGGWALEIGTFLDPKKHSAVNFSYRAAPHTPTPPSLYRPEQYPVQ